MGNIFIIGTRTFQALYASLGVVALKISGILLADETFVSPICKIGETSSFAPASIPLCACSDVIIPPWATYMSSIWAIFLIASMPELISITFMPPSL